MKKERDIAKLKCWCMRRHGEGVSAGEIYTAAQIPRSTFYDWLNHYRQHGFEGLQPKSRRPHTIHRTLAEIVDEIKTVRIRTGWGPQKIAGYLRTEGRPVGHMTVSRENLFGKCFAHSFHMPPRICFLSTFDRVGVASVASSP